MRSPSKLKWSPTAVSHFQNWIRFIAKDSVAAAERERQGILKSIERLKNFPQSGRIVPEFGNPFLREIIRKPMRIIYRREGNSLEILTFHHSKRQLDITLFS